MQNDNGNKSHSKINEILREFQHTEVSLNKNKKKLDQKMTESPSSKKKQSEEKE